jgi:hypothetical protein
VVLQGPHSPPLILVLITARSMVRAVEGMVQEKDSIFLAFFLSVVLFQSASLACCFVVMNHNAAWTSVAIFLIGLWYWYKYCLRIYNRFKVCLEQEGVRLISRSSKILASLGTMKIMRALKRVGPTSPQMRVNRALVDDSLLIVLE